MENLDNNIKNLNLSDDNINIQNLKINDSQNDSNFSKPKKYKNITSSESISVKKQIKDLPLPFFL